MPTLAVAMCTYNHAAFLGRALEALLGQSRAPDQVVVVDDGSADETPEILAALDAAHPNLKVVRNDQNRGVLYSSKRARDLAEGDYLYFASSDDYVLPGCFESLMRAVELGGGEVGIAFGDLLITDPAGRVTHRASPSHWSRSLHATPARFAEEYLWVEDANLSLCSSMVFRRDALEALGGFRVDLGPYADTFAANALALSHGACYVAEPLAVFRAEAGGFARRLERDPKSYRALAEATARTMAEPPFDTLFPADYPQRWLESRLEIVNRLEEKGYAAAQEVVLEAAASLELTEKEQAAIRQLQALKPGPPRSRG